MYRSLSAAAAALVLSGVGVAEAGAVDLPARCVPARAHRHVATHHRAPAAVFAGRSAWRHPPVYNYEDNGQHDADLPAAVPVGQPASWLDGYGTRPVYTPGYGVSDTYGGSSQRWWPGAIPPAGGLGVYIPGAYGPGPRIIHIPDPS